MSADSYRLLDFGDGRKLESLNGYCIDRPSPAAERVRIQSPKLWSNVDAIFDESNRTWTFHEEWPDSLALDCGPFRMPVRPTPHGHIGLFPEQSDNWVWLANASPPDDVCDALNLFGYTGASTLALVNAGYRVAHVDAAKPNVQAVRAAVACNHWDSPPIRYLVDDASKFAAREVRRGRRYHTIVLDPPAYGHGPTGRAWRLERDLWPLLDDCLQLMDPSSFRLLITGHSPEVDPKDVIQYLKRTDFYEDSDRGLLLRSGRSQLKDTHGRSLDAGFYVRVARQE
ncbi:MAG: SAM-dependent methyltransferase [Planctomycetota bacterium]